MSEALSFFVPGIPQGKGRPRVCVKGGRAWAFTPSKTRAYEDEIRGAFILRYPYHVPAEGPLDVEIQAYYPYPKSTPKSKRIQYKTTKPDADNIAKNIDALNGIAWEDDSQIWRLISIKEYTLDENKIGLFINIYLTNA